MEFLINNCFSVGQSARLLRFARGDTSTVGVDVGQPSLEPQGFLYFILHPLYFILLIMSTIQLTQANFQKEVLDFDGIVLVDFYADWCMPCRMLAPTLEELAKENADNPKIKIAKLNIEENQAIASDYGVQGIPNVIFFQGGKNVYRQVGVAPKEIYAKIFKQIESGELEKANSGVKVFSTPTCPYCVKLKEYLQEKKIDFEEVDVSKDQEAAFMMVSKTGQMGVPQTWINGEAVVGFNVPKINELLKID